MSRLTVIYVNITGSSSPPTLILPATLSDGVLGARFNFGAIGATPFNFHVTLDDEVDYRTRISGTGVVEIIKNRNLVPMAGGLFGATVSVSNQSFRTKVSVGSNPWVPGPLKHNLATICEKYGGGGHPRVGAISFEKGDVDGARRVADDVRSLLRT